MASISKYTIAVILILLGSVALCLFNFAGLAVPELLAMGCIGGGWLLAVDNAAKTSFTKPLINPNNWLVRSIRSPRGVRVIFFLLTVFTISVCLDVSNKIVSYVLTHLPSKDTTAKVTAVEKEFSSRHDVY